MRLALILTVLAACAPSLPRTVESLMASGDYDNALAVVLSAAQAGDARAVELLPGVVDDVYADLLDRAREAEAEDELMVSLGHYDALHALGAKVVAAGGPPVPSGLESERDKVARAAATKQYARASVAYDQGRWQDALDGWRLAEATDADATLSELRIPGALTMLGHAARDAQRYRDAITHYDDAVKAGGLEEPRVWSAAIHAALGRHALRNGACRKAVDELTKATALPFDVRLGEDLEAAKACATHDVVVYPLDDMVEGGVDTNLGVLLVDQLNHHLRAHGTRYLRLLSPDSKAAKNPPDEAGQRFEVRGHLTRIEVQTGTPTSETVTGAGALKVPCQVGGPPECMEEVTVHYTLKTERLAVDLAGAIEVVDVVTGERLATRPLDVRLSRTRYATSDATAKDVRGFGLRAPIGLQVTERSIGVRGDAVMHFSPSEPLPDTGKVIDEAMVRLAAEAAEAVLAAVDVEPPLPDPERLALITPVARAEDVVFKSAAIEEEPVPEDPIEGTEAEGDTDEQPVDDGADEPAPTP